MALQPNMQIVDHSPTYRIKAVRSLAEFRKEWEGITDGKSLLEETAPIGLLLDDIAARLELTPQERQVFLGKLLITEIEDFMKQKVRLVEQ